MRRGLLGRIVTLAALALAGLVAGAWPAAAEKRIALVVGNSAYKNVTRSTTRPGMPG